MKKVLLLGLFALNLAAMRKSPSMFSFQPETKHIQVYAVPDATWAPECSYCKHVAAYFVVSFNEFKFTYCKEHFRAAGYTTPPSNN